MMPMQSPDKRAGKHNAVHPLSCYGLVYVGTPYSKYPGGIEAAFRAAAVLTGRLLVAGVKAYSPIAHTHPVAIYSGLDPLDHDIWLPFDAAIMDKSDVLAVAAMDGWRDSYGLAHEIDVFRNAGKPCWLLDPNTLDVEALR